MKLRGLRMFSPVLRIIDKSLFHGSINILCQLINILRLLQHYSLILALGIYGLGLVILKTLKKPLRC